MGTFNCQTGGGGVQVIARARHSMDSGFRWNDECVTDALRFARLEFRCGALLAYSIELIKRPLTYSSLIWKGARTLKPKAAATVIAGILAVWRLSPLRAPDQTRVRKIEPRFAPSN